MPDQADFCAELTGKQLEFDHLRAVIECDTESLLQEVRSGELCSLTEPLENMLKIAHQAEDLLGEIENLKSALENRS